MSSTSKLPEIRIKYGFLLAENASEGLNKLYGDGTPLRKFEEYTETADRYTKVWRLYEKQILTGMCDLYGLTFRQDIIDVYVAPWFWAFSDPMVLGVTFSDDQVITNLTHELFHRLLTDNNETSYDTDYLAQWKQVLSGSHSWNKLVHIPVHAGLKAIYLDILKRPDLLGLDKKDVKKNLPYRQAWEYVDDHDYKTIIEKIKNSYKSQN